jgi:hypothetical protein
MGVAKRLRIVAILLSTLACLLVSRFVIGQVSKNAAFDQSVVPATLIPSDGSSDDVLGAPTNGDPGRDPAIAGTPDLYGNDINEAVATYKLDAAGNPYELHSPQTEVPRLRPPQS